MVFKLMCKVGLFEIMSIPFFHYFYENIHYEECVDRPALGFFLFCSAVAQTPANTPEAPYLKNPGIPPFKLLEVDSVHISHQR